MNEKGKGCFPSMATQAKNTGLSKPTIIKHLYIAEDEGFVQIKTHGYSGQKWARNEYTATYPNGVQLGLRESKGGKPILPPSKGKGGKADNKKVVKEVYSNTTLLNTPLKKIITKKEIADEMKVIWNSSAKQYNFTAFQSITDRRKESMNKVFAEQCNSNMDKWSEFCKKIKNNKFRLGENDRGWKANIDWVLRTTKDTVIMILEEIASKDPEDEGPRNFR